MQKIVALQISLGEGEQVETVQPAAFVKQFGQRDPELCFTGAVQDFDYQQTFFYFKAGPDFFQVVAAQEHGVFFIELFVGVDAVLVDYYQSFLPNAEERRFFVDFAEVVAVFAECFGDAREGRRLALVEFDSHIDEFMLNDEGEYEVVEGESLVGLVVGCDEYFCSVGAAEFDFVAVSDDESLNDFDFVYFFEEKGLVGDGELLILEGDGLFAPDFLPFFVGEKDVEGVFLGHFVVIFM